MRRCSLSHTSLSIWVASPRHLAKVRMLRSVCCQNDHHAPETAKQQNDTCRAVGTSRALALRNGSRHNWRYDTMYTFIGSQRDGLYTLGEYMTREQFTREKYHENSPSCAQKSSVVAAGPSTYLTPFFLMCKRYATPYAPIRLPFKKKNQKQSQESNIAWNRHEYRKRKYLHVYRHQNS